MHIAILADSILAGPAQTIPAVHEALELLGIDAEVINHTMQWRLLRQNLPNIESVIAARPDVVILGHGGSELMMVRRPRGAGRVANIPAESPRLARRRDFVHRVRGGNRRPAVRFSRFEADARMVVRELADRTDALIIFQGPTGVAHNMRPVAVRNRARRVELLEALEREYPERLRVLWLSTVLRQWDDFRTDRSHLSPSGQSAAAHLLAECLTSAKVGRR